MERLTEMRKDALEVKRQLNRVREDLGRETHAWLKANSAINDVLAAIGEPQIDQPERRTADLTSEDVEALECLRRAVVGEYGRMYPLGTGGIKFHHALAALDKVIAGRRG